METKKSAIEKMVEFLNEIKYPLLIILPLIAFQLFILFQLKQFPGPMYGGDIYWHFGETLDIFHGNAPWNNHQVTGEYAYYGWLTQFLVAITARLTMIDLSSVYLFFSVPLLILTAIVSYFLGKELFTERKFAIIMSIVSSGMAFTITDIWRILGDSILMMAFLLFLIKAWKSGKLKYSLLAGLCMGLGGLTHVITFPAMAAFLSIFFIYNTFFGHIHVSIKLNESKLSIEKDETKPSIKKNILILAPIFIIGLIISLIFFAPIIFVYHGKILNTVNEYGRPDLTKYGFNIMIESVAGTFFNMSNVFTIVSSIVVLAGLYMAIKNRKDFRAKFILLIAASAFISGFHYFITIPLMGKYLIPEYFFAFLMKTSSILLMTYAVFAIHEKILGDKNKNLFVYAAIGFVFINAIYVAYSSTNNQWISMGMDEQNPVYADISKWTMQNTNRDDIFLSEEELSFSLNGMTARKGMISRRTHFSPYLDIDQRIADAYVILYGNNTQKSKELIAKYNISYLYWDANWIYFAQNEPSLTSTKYENYLRENGVQFQKIQTYLDPAWSKYSAKYDMLALIPARINQSSPWNMELDKIIKLEKTFYINGQEYAKIYKIQLVR